MIEHDMTVMIYRALCMYQYRCEPEYNQQESKNDVPKTIEQIQDAYDEANKGLTE